MAEHTPGPWTTKNMDGSLFPSVVLPSKEEGWGESRIIINEGRADMEECQANARLIAAAPDLLEAAKEALHTLDVQASAQSEVWASAVRKPLRDAIAKAQEER